MSYSKCAIFPKGRKTLQNNRFAIALIAISILYFLVAPQSVRAQMARITGSVTDTSGAVIPGAAVSVENIATGVHRNTLTSPAGIYDVPGLEPGRYSVRVEKAGFEALQRSEITLYPATVARVDAQLKVGSEQQSVTVDAGAEQVNTETSENGGTITSQQLSNLMLDGRSFQTALLAIPGVTSIAGADQQAPATGTNSAKLIINGSSADYSGYTIDGVYDQELGGGRTLVISPIVDGISEMSVLKDNYGAQYGYTGSAQIVITTKSGTDTFHGSAWDYLRNSDFAADNYFSTTNPQLHQNVYGYTLGGPVIIPGLYNTHRTKKTFFFASNQWYSIHQASLFTGAVFPQAMRNGDFSASPTLKGSLTLDAHSQALLASTGRTNCILGPKTLNPACLDPVAVALLNADVPLPNNTAAGFDNYINQAPTITSELDYQYRVDHTFADKHLLTVRVMNEQVSTNYPYNYPTGTPYSTLPGVRESLGLWNVLGRLQSSFTPFFTNTLKLSYIKSPTDIFLTGNSGQLPAGVSITQAFPNAPFQNLIPEISISGGWSGNGVATPTVSDESLSLIGDDISWLRGKHFLQFGSQYYWELEHSFAGGNPQGSFSFSGTHTGDPAADYMLGLDSSYSQASTDPRGTDHYHQAEAYAQDDWKLTHRLTLNLGLHYYYFSAPTTDGGQINTFDAAQYNPAVAALVNLNGSFTVNSANQPLTSGGSVANLLNGLVSPGQNGVPDGFYTPVKTNFAPRVGFAYDLTGDGKTSIRGGYGIGYDVTSMVGVASVYGTNPPYNQSANILNSLLSNGTAGTATAVTPSTLNVIPLEFKPAQIQTYSLTTERQLIPDMIFALTYAGNQVRHQTPFGRPDMNAPLPVTTPSQANCLAAGQASSSAYQFDPCINKGTSSANYTRPYLGYASINNWQFSEGSSNYNALESGLTYRVPGGSQFSVAYTYSKSLSTISGAPANYSYQTAGPQNSRDYHAEYGPVSYDFTHNLTGTWVYNLPSIHNADKFVDTVANHWMFTGLVLYQSGFANTPRLAISNAGLATRPNQVGPIRKLGKMNEWFDTTAFAPPAYGFYGNASNGSLRGPSYTGLNVALAKTFPIGDRLSTQFRAEAFNLPNHPNFTTIATSLGAGNFGQVTAAGDPRIMEFALKLQF